MGRTYLLTYQQEKEGDCQYGWFETEEELRNFIKSENPYWVFDAFNILKAERLENDLINTR